MPVDAGRSSLTQTVLFIFFSQTSQTVENKIKTGKTIHGTIPVSLPYFYKDWMQLHKLYKSLWISRRKCALNRMVLIVFFRLDA